MNFLENMKKRYTTKVYDANVQIADTQIEALKEILHLSPSSIDSQPWKFIFVSKGNIKDQLAKASLFNEEKAKDCSHLIIFNVIDDTELFERQIRENLPQRSYDYYMNNIKPMGDTYIKSWASRQVYIALGVFLSACAQMDIDSTPMEGIETEQYARILNLKDYQPLVAVAIGKRDPKDINQPAITPKRRLQIEDILESL